MPNKFNVAVLSTSLYGSSKVDADNGIVFGCQLAKAGKLAVFRGLDGNRKAIMMTPKVIAGLLALFSESEQTTAHWTHDWIEKNEDGLKTKVATFRNFKINDTGDLVADAFLWPGEYRAAILHAAENDPQGMMISTVFDYEGGENDAIPTRVHAADFVETGAATVALLAKLQTTETTNNQNKKMDIQELLTALEDPAVKSALKAIIDSHDIAEPSGDETALNDKDTAAAMEKDAGVTDEDKKGETDEDKKAPAILSAIRRSIRAISRQRKSSVEETATLAEARFTKAIGNGKIILPGESKAGDEAEKYIQQQVAGGATRAKAILRMATDKPQVYNAARQAGKL